MAKRKRAYIDFRQETDRVAAAITTNAIATAVDDQVDYLYTNRGVYLEHKQTGASTALQFVSSVNGWLVPTDATDGEGVEITNGIVAGRDLSFTVGTDAAFYMSAGFFVTTIAAQDVYGCGFRKQGAYIDITTPATVASVYDDKAYIGAFDASGDWRTITSIANADTNTDITSTACANATFVFLKVKVSAAGAVTYEIGQSLTSYAVAKAAAAAPAGAVAMTITSGIILTPYLPVVSTGTASDIVLIEWDVGYQQS